MPRANVVHSVDACTVILKGDKREPEPAHAIVKFPGGIVEVARCSDGSYYAHLCINESAETIDSRIDYNFETGDRREEAGKIRIPKIEDQDGVIKMAIRVKGPYEGFDE